MKIRIRTWVFYRSRECCGSWRFAPNEVVSGLGSLSAYSVDGLKPLNGRPNCVPAYKATKHASEIRVYLKPGTSELEETDMLQLID